MIFGYLGQIKNVTKGYKKMKDITKFREWPIKEQMCYQARYWAFTDFKMMNWSSIYDDNANVKYIKVGNEIAPETGREHKQGFLQLIKPRKYSWFRKNLKGVDCSPAYSSIKSNIKYCEKDGKYETFGETSDAGCRTDLDGLYKKMKDGCSSWELLDQDASTYIKFHRGLERAKALCDKRLRCQRRLELLNNIFVLKGKAGSGKTRLILDMFGDENVYILEPKKKNEALWFDGYDGEKILLIDEFNGWIKYPKLLRILDIYKLRLNIKGGHTWAAWTSVFITTNGYGGDWYFKTSENLRRRIKRIYQLKIRRQEDEVDDSNMPVFNSDGHDFTSLAHSIGSRVADLSSSRFWEKSTTCQYGGFSSDEED